MNNDFQAKAKLQRTATVATIIIVIVAVLIIDHLKSSNSAAASAASVVTSTTTDSSTPATASSGTSSSQFKDGTYSSTVQYRVPHSIESIKVSLTVKNGVVTDSQVQNSEGDGTSAMFQESFASEYRSSVVGQSLSSLNLDIVAGASDTTIGFDQAVASIRTQAQG